jgi:hypothetical protein
VISSNAKDDLVTDPFARLYRHSVQGEAQQFAAERAEKLGYRVFKERKFCVTKGILGPFQEFLASRNARCIVYSV